MYGKPRSTKKINYRTRRNTFAKKRYTRYRPMVSNQELKWKDTNINAVACDSTGVLTLLNGMTKGTDGGNSQCRVGSKIVIKSIQMNMNNLATPSTGTDQSHRIVLLMDKEPNATTAVISDIWTSAGGYYNAVRNMDNRDRFNILYDRRFQLNASSESGSNKLHSCYKKVNIPVNFNTLNNGDIRDI